MVSQRLENGSVNKELITQLGEHESGELEFNGARWKAETGKSPKSQKLVSLDKQQQIANETLSQRK